MVQNEHLLLSWGGALQLSLMAPKIRFFSDPARMAAKQKEEEEKQKKEQEAKKVPEAKQEEEEEKQKEKQKKVKELSGSAMAVKELRHA